MTTEVTGEMSQAEWAAIFDPSVIVARVDPDYPWKRHPRAGKEPAKGSILMRALTIVRSSKERGVGTWDVVRALQRRQPYVTKKLEELGKRELVARQRPLPIPGALESTWRPVETDHWPVEKHPKQNGRPRARRST